MAFAKFKGNRFRIGGEITENHAILVNLTASIILIEVKINRVSQMTLGLTLQIGIAC